MYILIHKFIHKLLGLFSAKRNVSIFCLWLYYTDVDDRDDGLKKQLFRIYFYKFLL